MKPDKVLLVDNEVEFIETLAERMRVRGLAVRIAVSGPEAIEKAAGEVFDAIVLDLAMPGMDGIETLKRLRDMDPDLQIILLTGRGTVETAVEATKLGAIDFFEKPTDIELLIKEIKQARAKRIMFAEQKAHEDIENILNRRGW